MKVKLAILENDSVYLNRVASAFNIKYPDKLAVYAFTGLDMALKAIEDERIDVFVASDKFDIKVSELPKNCGFAYFVDSIGIETENGHPAICRFQRIDLIYKQILSIYSDKVNAVAGVGADDGSTKVVVFNSPCGGTGTSSVAAAAAVRFAAGGRKTLYLNLETSGCADSFFTGDGQYGMSDIIFALKSGRPNLPLKLESTVKLDHRGVYFYSGTKNVLDRLELSGEELVRLINSLKVVGEFDVIIVDKEFGLQEDELKLMRQSSSVVWVSNGSEIANLKIARAMEAIEILDRNSGASISGRLMLIYNGFSNKTGKTLEKDGLRVIGGMPRFEHATLEQVIEQLAGFEDLEKITG